MDKLITNHRIIHGRWLPPVTSFADNVIWTPAGAGPFHFQNLSVSRGPITKAQNSHSPQPLRRGPSRAQINRRCFAFVEQALLREKRREADKTWRRRSPSSPPSSCYSSPRRRLRPRPLGCRRRRASSRSPPPRCAASTTPPTTASCSSTTASPSPRRWGN